MKDLTVNEFELLLVLVNTAINDHKRLAEFTAAPEQCKKNIEEYEALQGKLIYYTIGRRIQDETKSQSDGLQPGKEKG